MSEPDDPTGTGDATFGSVLSLHIQEDIMRGAPARVVDGAKQVITLSTVLAGAYFTGTAFAQIGGIPSLYLRVVYLLPIIFWAATVLLAVPVAVPFREYGARLGEPLSAKSVFVSMVSGRVWYLRLALIVQALGIVAMLVVLWLQLGPAAGDAR